LAINFPIIQTNAASRCDDSFDLLTELRIPMDFKNSFVFLTTTPTQARINSHPSIEMTNDAPWDPSTVGRKQLLWEEEE
jgi:hypothetical protein